MESQRVLVLACETRPKRFMGPPENLERIDNIPDRKVVSMATFFGPNFQRGLRIAAANIARFRLESLQYCLNQSANRTRRSILLTGLTRA